MTACPHSRGRYICHDFCGCVKVADPVGWWWAKFGVVWRSIGYEYSRFSSFKKAK